VTRHAHSLSRFEKSNRFVALAGVFVLGDGRGMGLVPFSDFASRFPGRDDPQSRAVPKARGVVGHQRQVVNKRGSRDPGVLGRDRLSASLIPYVIPPHTDVEGRLQDLYDSRTRDKRWNPFLPQRAR